MGGVVLAEIVSVMGALLASGLLKSHPDPEALAEFMIMKVAACFGVQLQSGFLTRIVAYYLLHKDDPGPPTEPPEFMHSPPLIATEFDDDGGPKFILHQLPVWNPDGGGG